MVLCDSWCFLVVVGGSGWLWLLLVFGGSLWFLFVLCSSLWFFVVLSSSLLFLVVLGGFFCGS